MTSKKTAITVSVSMVVLFGGIITYAIMQASPSKLKTSDTVMTTTVTPEAVNQGTGNTLGVSGLGGESLGLQSNLASDRSSGGVSSTNGSGGSSQQAPGPDSFSQYDQYKDKDTAMFMDIAPGTGTEVAAESKVQVTYKGWLTNGTLFDQSSVNDKGQTEAFSFIVGAHTVIPGWEQAIVGMKVGGTRRMIIPPVAGYGTEAKDKIPANSLLIFDVILHAAL